MQKVTSALFSLKEVTASLRLRFCNQVLLDLHRVDEVKNFAANNLLQVGRLVTYWDSYIEEFRGSEVVEGFCCKFIYENCRV